jgi:very-short-patch-repair endonuclease
LPTAARSQRVLSTASDGVLRDSAVQGDRLCMAKVLSEDLADEFAELCDSQAGVLTVTSAVKCLGKSAVRWRLASGRWRRAGPGVLVAQSGPLTEEQRLWVLVLAAGHGAVLAGLTAARLDGLAGFEDRSTYVLIPASRQIRQALPGVVVHRSALLGPADVHPSRRPPRTRLGRSLVDAAAWAATDRRARAVLAGGVQQRLVRASDLSRVVERRPRVPRRALMRATLADIAGGAEALSELDFCDLVRRFRLPEPDRQFERLDEQGRRWLDAVWEWARLVAEIDGRYHMDARTWWADMQRDNDLTIDGYRVLRFPAFVVRDNPEVVARQITQALRQVGVVTEPAGG